jgi:hypothetical protein
MVSEQPIPRTVKHHFRIEVEGIQGAGPQIVFWGGWLPKVT